MQNFSRLTCKFKLHTYINLFQMSPKTTSIFSGSIIGSAVLLIYANGCMENKFHRVQKNFFMKRVVRLHREVVESQSLEVFLSCVEVVLTDLV